MSHKLTKSEIKKVHDKAVLEIKNKKVKPVFDDPYDKIRPRNGAIWKDEEMNDLRAMVNRKYKLERIAGILYRSKQATLTRIMKYGMASQALKYMPEARYYIRRVEQFSGRCYYVKK